MSDASAERLHVAARGRRLEYFTIGWNAMEGIAAVAAVSSQEAFRLPLLASTVSSK
jgi:hypothetical protein